MKTKLFKLGLFALIALVAVLALNSGCDLTELGGVAMATLPIVFVEKSEAELDKMSFEERKAYMNDWLNDAMQKQEAKMQPRLDALNERLEKGEKLEGELKVEKDAIEAKLNAAIGELKVMGHRIASINDTSGKREVATSIKAALEAKKEDIAKFKNRTINKFEIEVDVEKATQGASDIDSGTDFAQMMPGIGKIPHKRRYIKDRIRVIPTNTEYIKYLDQETVVRDAKNVAACGTTTHNTKLTWKTYTVQQQKVRDFVHICLDMMDDYDFVEAEIRNLINSSLQLKVDSDLLLANGVAPNVNSIDSISATFDATSAGANYFGEVEAATVIDLIVVAGAQISAFGSENFWEADTAYMNPKDITLLKLLKDNEENYIKGNSIAPRVIGMRNGNFLVDGTIEVIKNPNVPENEMYVFDSTRAAIVQRKTVVIEFSYENRENFETETVTVKGYERLNLWVRNVDANAFLHIDDIAAALVSITAT